MIGGLIVDGEPETFNQLAGTLGFSTMPELSPRGRQMQDAGNPVFALWGNGINRITGTEDELYAFMIGWRSRAVFDGY